MFPGVLFLSIYKELVVHLVRTVGFACLPFFFGFILLLIFFPPRPRPRAFGSSGAKVETCTTAVEQPQQ